MSNNLSHKDIFPDAASNSTNLPSGQNFAAAVKSDFHTAAESFNTFTAVLNAIKARKNTDKSANLLRGVS